jgi:hypothetical protein
MKKYYLLLVLFVLAYTNIGAAIEFKNNPRRIVITGNETGNDLRWEFRYSYHSEWGHVQGRNVFLKCPLIIKNGARFTDNNATFTFYEDGSFRPQSNSTINFTDNTIISSGYPKGANVGGYNSIFTRVSFLQTVSSGQSDIFDDVNSNHQITDLNISLNGDNDKLYLKTPTQINNIIVNSAKNHNLYIGPGGNDEIETINGLQLIGINSIIGHNTAQGDVIIKELEWNKPDWEFTTNNVDVKIVDPIKPSIWNGYSGSCEKVKEYTTHKILVLDHYRAPLNNAIVALWNNSESNFDYKEKTGSEGKIAIQEILKIENNSSLNHNRGPWKLLVTEYSKEYFIRLRNFDKPVDEEVIVLPDNGVTEQIRSVVNAYTTVDNASALYDKAKLWKTKKSHIHTPSFEELLIKRNGRFLYLPNGWNLVIDKNLGSAFEVDGTTIKVKTAKLLRSSKYNRLIVDGTISFVNDEIIDFPYSDATHNSYVRFVDLLPTDEVTIKRKSDGAELKNYIGECGYSYNATEGDTIMVELERANGESSMTYYPLNKKGLDNYLRMGISDIYLETMFNRTDRDVLYTAVDKILAKLLAKDASIDEMIYWMKLLIQKVQENPKKFSY